MKVGASLRGHLGLVGYTKNLSLVAQFAQQATDDFGRAATNTDIDLVKYQGGNAGSAGGNHLNSQADARQFTTGGHFVQWSGGVPGLVLTRKRISSMP